MAASLDVTCPVEGGAGHPIKLAEVVAEEALRHPGAVIETFAADERRIGLKPILRRVWAPGASARSPAATTATNGSTSPPSSRPPPARASGISPPASERRPSRTPLFAREAGAGRDWIILLVLDGAGWHTAPLRVPEGTRLVYLPPCTPELQPAETLWVHVDEPIVNRHFDTLADLDAVVAERCRVLGNDRNLIRSQAGFHWRPNRAVPI